MIFDLGEAIMLPPSDQTAGRARRRLREATGRMDEVLARKMLDQRCAGLAHLGPQLDRCFGARHLQCLARQAQEKILRARVRQEFISTDRLACDARDHAAVRHATTARENVDQHGADGDPLFPVDAC